MTRGGLSLGTTLHSVPKVEMVISKYQAGNQRWTVIKLSRRRKSSVTADHVVLCYASLNTLHLLSLIITINPRTVMFYLCYLGSRDGAVVRALASH